MPSMYGKHVIAPAIPDATPRELAVVEQAIRDEVGGTLCHLSREDMQGRAKRIYADAEHMAIYDNCPMVAVAMKMENARG